MSEVLELNREEITRLSRMDDVNGHAWAFYLLLKKHMDIYTGLVQVEKSVLVSVTAMQLHLTDSHAGHNSYLEKLINLLIKAEVISDYLLTKDIISIKLPIAYSDICLESHNQH